MAGLDWKIFLLAHGLATGLFLFFNLKGKNRLQAVTETVIVFCVPVAGLFVLCLFKFFGGLLRLWDLHEIEEEGEGESFFIGAPVQKDVVPLNDAFLVEDKLQKRHFFTESIKQSLVENQQILRMAMHDQDREIAYYAVSMLTSRMENLEGELFDRESKVLKGEKQENLPLLQEYAELLKEYMGNKSFIDHVSWRKKQEIYVAILDRLTKLTEDNKGYFKDEVDQLLQLPDYPGAEQVCRDFQSRYPGEEEPYLSFVALYVAWKQPEKLQACLQALKALPIELSPEALRVIRFWDRGAAKIG